MSEPVRYRALCADPPWPFRDKLPGNGRGAAKHYRLLTVDEICRFPLPLLADDALCFLWRVAAQQEDALRVMRAWGFVPTAEVVWLKRTSHGKRWFGMGRIVRHAHEVCLIGKRGRPVIECKSVRSVFEAPAGRHSEKPQAFYAEVVQRLIGGPYVELFARGSRPGWTCLGDESSEDR